MVGKAITFDSGGISLKPWEGMEEMKHDMSGGAAVLGAVCAAAMLKLPVNIVGLIPATENLPGGAAYKPGDVLISMSGITIEVISTDAEGRLILSDALAYAARYKPAAIIDLATLTGACIIALGHHNTGLMANDDGLVAKIEAAARMTSEKVWRLPLDDEYADQIKSDIADVKNVGGRPAGAITAGLFLKKFVGDIPWAHLDIAGSAWLKESKPYIPKGATGVGVRLLTQLAKGWKK
jgi:leucyl aminopeptidase